jgi:hypothetical protein
MMKKLNDYQYVEISTFEDFRYEKENLIFRKKLIETKLNLTYLQIREVFSISNMLTSVAKEVVLPKISDFLTGLINKVEEEVDT